MSSTVKLTGTPIHILKPDDDYRIELNENALKNLLLDKRVRNSKLMIVSIFGWSRTGKSFLLNYFLRYLSRSDKNWMGDPKEPLKGFLWKSDLDYCVYEDMWMNGDMQFDRGSEGPFPLCTGIFLWSEPFFINMPSGESVCILLMDIQDDLPGGSSIHSIILSLISLISSVQICNSFLAFESHDLEYLMTISCTGKKILEAYSQGTNKFSDKYIKQSWKAFKNKPFQHLQIVVQHFYQGGPKKAYGYSDGMTHVKETVRMKRIRRETWDDICRSYDKMKCYIMPPPGGDVSDQTYDGNVSGLDPEFKEHLKFFTESLFAPENVVIKSINGKAVTGEELLEYIKTYVKAFQFCNVEETFGRGDCMTFMNHSA